MKALEVRLIESITNKGCYKVWIKTAVGSGFLRGGFAWKTKGGAVNAAIKRFPESFILY